MRLGVLPTVAALLIGACQGVAQTIADADIQALRQQMEASHIPDVALAVFEGGAVRFACCSTGPLQPGPETAFEAASLGKPVFAAAVLNLAHDGRLDLDRPLLSYLQRPYQHSQNVFDATAPTDTVTAPQLEKVTARMVLSHTAGLPNWSRGRPLTFVGKPGGRWSYSGEGYIYLQCVVEKITGRKADQFVRESVLDPLGMKHSSFVWTSEIGAHALDGHDANGKSSPITRYDHAVVSSTLYTTLHDYALFVSALLAARPGSPLYLERQTQATVDPGLGLRWGLGVAIEKSDGSFFHWGANPGFQSMFFEQPSTGRGVLFLTDSDRGLDLVDILVKRYVPGSHPALQFPMLHPKD